MKKLYTAFLSFIFISAIVKAQPYRNEWILFATNQPYSTQKYLKIKVWQEGIHRISFNDITQYLPEIINDSINPKRFQVFHQGKEQFIYLAGESDNIFDPADYIEFYGQPNDGSFDTQMYDSVQHQTNPYYSLINDTAAYFFTINANPIALNRRMIIDNDSNFPNYNPASYVMKEAVQSYHAVYEDATSQYDLDASYTIGEGWTGGFFAGTSTFNLPVPNVFNGPAPLATASTYFIGDNYPGPERVWTISVNNSSLQTVSFYDFSVFKIEAQVSNSILSGGSADFKFNQDVAVADERNTVPFIRILYPHTLSFTGENSAFQKFTVPADQALSKTRLDITDFLTGNSAIRWLYVFSDDTIRKANVDLNGSLYQTLVPTFGIEKRCFLTTDSSVISSGGFNIAPVTDNAQFTNFNFSGVTNSNYLIVSHKSLMTDAADYKAFRGGIPGGSYNVLLADIDELYDQFAWGINKHPLSIRNFVRFALDTFSVEPKYLFLIGKSIKTNNGINPSPRKYPPYYAQDLIPTYGSPPSDVIMVSRIHDNIFHPEIAVGRLAAQTPQDVQMYLDKVMDHDYWLTQQPEEWMKQILHFGGGTNVNEQDLIRQKLNIYKGIIEDTLFAGHVTTFLKTSTDPIQANQSAYLQNLIDSGVTLMTFFSHAAGSSFDITTDAPSNYKNYRKYPVIFANSCFIGDIHTPSRQASEDFILQTDKGAIGFIASPNTGFIEDQFAYGEPFYKQIAYYGYGEGIGDCMKKCIDSVNYSSPVYRKSVTMGMTLHGDPALRLYPQSKPDLVVTQPGVFFTPANITAELDSFTINIVVKNIGRAIDKDYTLEVTRVFPDGVTDTVFTRLLSAMPFVDTIPIIVPMDFARASGPNTFNVVVDASLPAQIDELREDNNEVTAFLLIRSSDINPVYPFKYAIIPNNISVKVKASTANLFAPLTAYRFEIDTTDRFVNILNPGNNVVSSIGGIVEYQIPFTLLPNKVYYWRVANNAILQDTVNYHWKESSFIYIPGKTGWSQAHYSQFKEDEYRNVVYKNSMPPADTTFQFVDIASSILCHTSYTPDQIGGHPVDYYINNLYMACCGCSYTQINMAVLDSITLTPWTTDVHFLGNANTYYPATNSGYCTDGYAPKYFLYPSDSVSLITYQDSLANALDNLIPDGNYILIYTLGGGRYSEWNSNLTAAFDSLGTVPSAQNYQPFIYFTKKGSGTSTIIYADSLNNIDITFDTIIGGNWDKGFIKSIRIGPATSWSELHWGQHPVEASSFEDSIDVSVIGIDTLNQETTLIANLPPSVADSTLYHIDANTYPYLKLEAYVQDELYETPPQLDRWQIYFEEVPEAALAPNKWFKPYPFADTLDEGANIHLEMAIENISSKNMDSMLVDFYVFDKNHTRHNVSSPKYRPLPAGDTVIASVSFNTKNYTGLNSLWIEANPHDDQPEQYHFNNLAELLFQVNRDITNPILDVTFDGQHILDGDIVSAKPFILVKLKDENKYLALDDTSNYRVLITDPAGKTTQPYFETAPNQSTDRAKLKWTPAASAGTNNSFTIEFNPILDVDGIYYLDVQAYDESGNISGANSYKISFEVINRSTITEFVNYPNPFSTSTRFVFTLTGSEIPQQLLIQIMTVSGKIVREITQDEIGSLHIGRNITQYAWDGRDTYGDRLANGIYFYRVQTRLNNQSIEHRETEADKFFKKGFGKMYLMR